MKYTLRDVLSSLFRYSRALVLFWIVVVVVAVVFYSQTKKLYDSKAKVLISLGTEALGKADYVSGQNRMMLQREQQIHNEQQILQSHEVMLTTAKWVLGDPTPGWREPTMDSRMTEAKTYFTGQDPAPSFLLGITKSINGGLDHLFGHPPTHDERVEAVAQELSSDLSVKAIFDSDALDVNFRYRNATVAQTTLSLIIDAYLQHHISVFQNNTEANLLKVQMERSVDTYHQRLSEFSSFMNTHQVYNDDNQMTVLIEQREKLKQALNEALADNDSASARLASLGGIQDSLHQLERYSTTETRNKERDALLAKLNDATVEERTILTRHPKESRAYQDEQAKLDELRQLVQNEPEHVVQETEQRKSKASEYVDSEVIGVKEAQRGDVARISRLRADLANIDSEINRYATDLKGYNALKLDLSLAKQESEQMAQVYVGSRLKNLTAQNSITDISIIDIPSLDSNPASPNKKLLLAATVLLLLVGSFGLLFACMNLDTTVADGATAELRLGVPVVGTIPAMRPGEKLASNPESFALENQQEFARIYQSVKDRGPEGRVILLTESGSEEGVSLVGYGLSRFLGRQVHQKTALIDRTAAPLAMAASASVLSTRDRAGQQLATVDRPIQAWAGGEQTTFRSAGDDLEALVLKLRQEFAYVVVAGGAVKDSTDLLTISGIVSAVFFVVEAGKTRRAAARYSLELLRRYGFQSIRLILNKRVYYIPGWLMRFV